MLMSVDVAVVRARRGGGVSPLPNAINGRVSRVCTVHPRTGCVGVYCGLCDVPQLDAWLDVCFERLWTTFPNGT